MSRKTYLLPVGPIHPALKEPAILRFEIDGEEIVDVDVEMGNVHRGIEWIGMHQNPIKTLYTAERICGICSASHQFAFCRVIEAAAGIDVAERADYIRVIIAELERIHSHILWAGVAAHEIGFDTLLHLTWQVREKVMDCLEHLSGNRVNYAMYTFGGVRRDITPEQLPYVEDCLKYYEGMLGSIKGLFLKDKTIAMRSDHCGILSYDDAIKLCAVGPTARASGVAKDVRYGIPYSAYADLDLTPVLPNPVRGKAVGDIYDRIIVRVLEIAQSIDLIRQCLERMPAGPITTEPNAAALLAKLKNAQGEAIGRHEAPRGEVFHYVHLAGAEAPAAWKVKAPTYNNLATWKTMLVGEQIADIPIIAASIDPCMSCTDRVAVLKHNTMAYLTKDDLRALSIRKTRGLMRQ